MVKTPALLILLEKDVLNLAYPERPPGELKTVGANEELNSADEKTVGANEELNSAGLLKFVPIHTRVRWAGDLNQLPKSIASAVRRVSRLTTRLVQPQAIPRYSTRPAHMHAASQFSDHAAVVKRRPGGCAGLL